MVRTLPIRLAPLPGESLGSWLYALAHRSMVGLGDLESAVDLPRRPDGRKPALDCAARLLPDEAVRLAEATGVPAHRLHAMTLEVYDGHALLIQDHSYQVNRVRLWCRSAGSRYCPQCLAERDGRWLLRWQLTWSMACTRHRVLLAHVCPTCGNRPHARTRRSGAPAPNQCAAFLEGRGRQRMYCRADLSLAHAIRLEPTSPVLAAQAWIDQLLSRIELHGHDAPAARPVFEDLTMLASWVLARAEPGDFLAHDPEIERARTRHGHESQHAPVDAAVLAGPLTRAVEIYQALETEAGQAAMRTLIDRDKAAIKGVSPGYIKRRSHAQSGLLQQAIWRAMDRHLETSARLRYRSCSPRAQSPIPADPRIALRARSIPQLLWRDWAVMLLPPRPREDRRPKAALATALLLPGWAAHGFTSLREMLHGHQRISLDHFLAKLVGSCGTDILTAICAIADYLDAHPAPIDYQRRRGLDGDGLLPEPTWIDICRRTDTHPGVDQARLVAMRRYLYQRITGNDLFAATSPMTVASRTPGAVRLAAVPYLLTEPLLTALDEHGAGYLRAHGIEEPVTWSPPMHLAEGLDLPGMRTSCIDLGRELQAVRDKQFTPAHAARVLGTSVDHFKLYCESHPSEQPLAASADALPTIKTFLSRRSQASLRERSERILTREFLIEQYINANKTAGMIAAEQGLTEAEVRNRLQATDVRRGRGRAKITKGAAWFTEQYVNRGRTMGEIAAELGVTHHAIRYRLMQCNIAIRPATTANALPATLHSRVPEALRPVLKSRSGLERLRRFKTAMESQTIPAAAASLGLRPSSLSTQIHRLESQFGAKLYERSRGRAITPTPEGQVILRALSEFEKITNSEILAVSHFTAAAAAPQ